MMQRRLPAQLPTFPSNTRFRPDSRRNLFRTPPCPAAPAKVYAAPRSRNPPACHRWPIPARHRVANDRLTQCQRLRRSALFAAGRHNAHRRKFRKFGSQRAQSRRFVAVIVSQKYVRHGEGKREASPDQCRATFSVTHLGYAIFAYHTKPRDLSFPKFAAPQTNATR